MKTLYEELGIKKEASAAEVKRAYKHKAQQVHPDKEGGSAEAFNKVKQAYDILSNEEKRIQYDEHGTIDHTTTTIRDDAIAEIANLFMQVINNVDFKYNNLIEKLKSISNEQISTVAKHKESIAAIIERNRAIAERMNVKEGQENLFTRMLDADTATQNGKVAALDKAANVFKEVLQILEDYEYTVDQRQSVSVNPWEILEQINKQSGKRTPWSMG